MIIVQLLTCVFPRGILTMITNYETISYKPNAITIVSYTTMFPQLRVVNMLKHVVETAIGYFL